MTALCYCTLAVCLVLHIGLLPCAAAESNATTEASTSQPPSTVPSTSVSSSDAPKTSTTEKPGTTSGPRTTLTLTTPPKNVSGCETQSSCKSCTDSRKCFWCSSTKTCATYPSSKIVPRNCPKHNWYWEQCVVSGFVLIILVPSAIGLFLLGCGCFIYCKCCRTRKTWKKEEDRITQRRKERAVKADERKADRQARADAIRMKYGLLKSDDEEPLI